MSFDERMAWITKLPREELELKYEMCLERIETLDEEARRDNEELERMRQAMALISEGLNVLGCMATVARPSEFEELLREFAPFRKVADEYFPKKKRKARSLSSAIRLD